jgi:hypothetical protein
VIKDHVITNFLTVPRTGMIYFLGRIWLAPNVGQKKTKKLQLYLELISGCCFMFYLKVIEAVWINNIPTE